jgi:hypothetical protein
VQVRLTALELVGKIQADINNCALLNHVFFNSSSSSITKHFLPSNAKMDPLSALSLASSVVQLIDFGCKVIRQTKEVDQFGSTVTIGYLSDATSDLTKITSSLQLQLVKNRKLADLLEDEEQVSPKFPVTV